MKVSKERVTKKCLNCGEKFETTRSLHVYCSYICRQQVIGLRYRQGKSRKHHLLLARLRQKRYKEQNLEKIKTQKLLQYAVKKGYVIKPAYCEKCFVNCKPQGHHKDYSKPLEVMWLCPKCHKEIHLCG